MMKRCVFETGLEDREGLRGCELLFQSSREFQSLRAALEKALSLKLSRLDLGADRRPVEMDLRGRECWQGEKRLVRYGRARWWRAW